MLIYWPKVSFILLYTNQLVGYENRKLGIHIKNICLAWYTTLFWCSWPFSASSFQKVYFIILSITMYNRRLNSLKKNLQCTARHTNDILQMFPRIFLPNIGSSSCSSSGSLQERPEKLVHLFAKLVVLYVWMQDTVRQGWADLRDLLCFAPSTGASHKMVAQ